MAQAPDADTITVDHTAPGIDETIKEPGFAIDERESNDLSDMIQQLLLAMQQDALNALKSSIANIQQGLPQNRSWTFHCRSRLIHTGVIKPAGRGRVRYALPYLTEFLADHGVRHE